MFTNYFVPDESTAASPDDTCAREPVDALRSDGRFRPAANLRANNNRFTRAPLCEQAAVDAKVPSVEISPAQGFRRRAVSWTGVMAEFIESTVRARSEYRFRAPVHLLIVYEQGARHSGETFLQGLPPSKLRDFTRRFTFVPAGREFHEWQEPRTSTRIMCIYFDPANLPFDFGLRVTDESFAPRLFFEDAVLWDTVLKLKKLVDNPSAEDRLYFVAIGAVLMHEITRLNQRVSSAHPRLRGGLAAWQRRLVSTYIDEHLAERVPLATLAALVRLSPFHFCRAFKQSFGVPPHRYHSQRRMERAKLLLVDPDFSVTEIGLALGFSETSSFTTAFRRATGMTPTGYHRNLTAVTATPKLSPHATAASAQAFANRTGEGEFSQ